MSVIEVRVLAHLIDLFGTKKINYSFNDRLDIYELLDKLDDLYGLGKYIYKNKDDKSLIDDIRVMLRGRDIRFLDKELLNLEDGDIVLIIPMLAGG